MQRKQSHANSVKVNFFLDEFYFNQIEEKKGLASFSLSLHENTNNTPTQC